MLPNNMHKYSLPPTEEETEARRGCAVGPRSHRRCQGPAVVAHGRGGAGEGAAAHPVSFSRRWFSYPSHCFPDPNNASAGSSAAGIGVQATPPACQPACQGAPRAPLMAGAGPAKASAHGHPTHPGTATQACPSPAQVPSSSLPWCLCPPPPPSPHHFPRFLLLSAHLAPSHSDLSLRVTSSESTVTWLQSPSLAGRSAQRVQRSAWGSGGQSRLVSHLRLSGFCPWHVH